MTHEEGSGTQLEERLRLALMMAHVAFCELEQFAGTTDVLRPIVMGQRYCRWDQPEWSDLMAELEEQIAAEAAEEAEDPDKA